MSEEKKKRNEKEKEEEYKVRFKSGSLLLKNIIKDRFSAI